MALDQLLVLVFFNLISGILAQNGSSSAAISEIYVSCAPAPYEYDKGSAFGKNLGILLQSLQKNAPVNAYNTSTQGSGGDTVYGLLQCRGDLSKNLCSYCSSAAVNKISNCTQQRAKGGRVQLQTCFLRYEDHLFFSQADNTGLSRNCSSTNTSGAGFKKNVNDALRYVVQELPELPKRYVSTVTGFGTTDVAYALGQCVPDLTATDCATCIGSVKDCLTLNCGDNTGGFCYDATCSLRFDNNKFFDGIPSTTSIRGNKSSSHAKVIGISVGAAAAALLLLAVVLLAVCRSKRKKPAPKVTEIEYNELRATLHRGPVTFSYEMLKRCTGDFSAANKLGQGGFGAVYKGTFSDGTEVAIKKLSIASRQGEQQFLNEVKVISAVQHKNLVKLLGCCVEGDEKLLVYEYLPNNSLEKALFEEEEKDKEDGKVKTSWESRYQILLGTARGLCYLHEDSQVRIVHRDIKPSNILLDESFEAKISDFGLARLYGDDEATEIMDTKVAGTYGYMAPEYAYHGKLSEKADVFSYGIVLLETISGKKSRSLDLPAGQSYLLDWALKLNEEGRVLDMVDSRIIGHVPEREALQAIHVALMSTQASPQARPSMSHVVAVLSGHSNVVAFLSPSSHSSTISSTSSSSTATTASSASAKTDFSGSTILEPR